MQLILPESIKKADINLHIPEFVYIFESSIYSKIFTQTYSLMKRFTPAFRLAIPVVFVLTGILFHTSTHAQNPQISISPDTLHAWLNTCQDSVTQSLTISNTGTNPLFFDILQSSEFTEGFEEGLDKWQKTGSWATTTFSAYEGSYSATESPGGNYGNYWSMYIQLKDSLIITNKDSAILSFYERHYLECNYDYLYVQLSVNNGGYFNLMNLNCSSGSWTQRLVNLSGYVNNGDYIKIRFYFYSDVSYTYDGVYLDKIRIGGVGSNVPWIGLPVTVGVVQPGESMVLDIKFYSQLLSGTNTTVLTFQTNDPLNPLVQIPLILHFNGYPILIPEESAHDFGEIMAYTENVDTVYFTNTGCDLLEVTNLYCDIPEFVPLIPSFNLLPGAEKAVPVKFQPESAGVFAAGLFLETNDTSLVPSEPVVTLSGIATETPVISLDPDTLFVTLACGDSTDLSVNLANTGGNDLHYQVLFNAQSEGLILYYPLDGNANDFSVSGLHGTITGAVPTTDRFNQAGMALNLDGTDDFVQAPPAVYFGGDFTVAAWVNINAVKTWSRLFDFGNGQTNNNVLAAMSNGTSGIFCGEVYYNSYSGGKTNSPEAVPLNEWVFLCFVHESNANYLYKNGELWASGYSSYNPTALIRNFNYIGRSNWAADQYLQGKIDEFRIYNQGFSSDEIENLYLNENYSWLSGTNTADTLTPGQSVTIPFQVSAAGLNAGTYESHALFSSNDPQHPVVPLTVILTVTGEPVGSVSQNSLQFDTILQHTHTYSTFTVYNSGCDTLHFEEFIAAGDGFFIPDVEEYDFVLPGDSVAIDVVFHPVVPGDHSGTIGLQTNDGLYEIILNGFAIGAPVLSLIPDPLYASFSTCDQTDTLTLEIFNAGLSDLNWSANSATNAGTALSFNGYGQWVSLGNLGAMPDQGTIEFWQWSNALTNYNNSFCTNGLDYYQGNRGIRFEEDESGLFGVVFGDDNATYNGYNITPSLDVNTWHHIAVSWDKNTNQVWTYFDGNLVTDGAYCSYWATEWTEAYIGVGWADWRWWDGMIDEFRIWNILRNQTDIQATMFSALTGGESGLMAYWDMNEGSGETVTDKTANHHNGTTQGSVWETSSVPIQSFVSVIQNSGNLPAGTGQTIQAIISGTGIPAGNHSSFIQFYSNDPLSGVYLYPVNLTISGDPVLWIESTLLGFGEVMQYTTRTDSILFRNTGCDTLLLSEITPQESDFHFLNLPIQIPAYDSAYLKVSFNPQEAWAYDEYFSLLTNDGTTDLHLTGNSISAPQFFMDPTFSEVWVPCYDSVMVAVQISNTGGSLLSIQPGQIQASADISQPDPPLCTPQAYNHCCGIGIYHVQLADLDHSPLVTGSFNDYSLTANTMLSAGQTYTLYVETGLDYYQDAYAWIDFNNNGVFEETEQILNSQDQLQYHQHTFTVPADVVKNIPLRMRIGTDYYSENALSSCNSPYYGQYADYGVLIQKVLTYSLPQDSLEPGNSMEVQVWFNADGLLSGDYTPSFTLLTNDPLQPVVTYSAILHVYGSGGFTTDTDTVDFGEVMINSYPERTLIISNTGCTTLEVVDAYSIDPVFQIDPTVFSLEPGQSIPVTIRFNIDWVGYVESEIWFITNSGDYSIAASGTGTYPPDIWIDDPWLYTDTYCGQTSTLELLVNNYSLGEGSYSIEPCTDIREHLELYYMFDGNTADSSGFGRDAEINMPIPTEGHNGDYPGGYYYNNGVAISYNNSEVIGTSLNPETMTVSFWVKISQDYATQSPTPCLFSMGGNPDNGDGIRISCINDSIVASIGANGSTYTVKAAAIFDEYFMVTAVHDWYTLHLFINENWISEIAVANALTWNPDYNRIGIGWNNGDPGDERFFTGSLDDVRVYSTPLWSEKVKFLSGNFESMNGISFEPDSGIIAGSSVAQIQVTIQTDSTSAGYYENYYYLASNDPEDPKLIFRVAQYLDGVAGIAVNPQDIYFPETFMYTQVTDSVLIENPGCNTLYIWNVYSETPNFYPLTTYFEIPAHSSAWLPVAFNPQEAGDLMDYIHLANDVTGEQIVQVYGLGHAIPVIEVDPASINTYLSCVETSTKILTIYNTGAADLELFISLSEPAAWVQLAPVESQAPTIVPPGGFVQYSLFFDRAGLPIALYTNTLVITSNDPYQGYVEVPVYMLIPNPLVGVNLGNDTSYCEGQTLVLHGGNYATYLWSDGSTGNTLTVSEPGQYWVSVNDLYECPSSDTITVTSKPYPIVSVGNDTTLCANGSILLNANIINVQPPEPFTTIIGNGTTYSTETGPDPFGTYYMDHRVQLLYKKSELLTSGILSGNITGLGFILNGVGNPGMSGLTIRLGTTLQNSLTGFVSGLQVVYSISYYYPHTGQNIFELPVPYFWNGNSNLIVEVCFDNNSWNSNSSFQYTTVNGSVWGNYCDNCNSGCNLTGGASYSSRANLLIRGDGDMCKYYWTGPMGFSANFRNPVISNAQVNQNGLYLLSVDNGYGCFGSDTLQVDILPTPTAYAGSDLNLLGYDSVVIQASLGGGIPPYTITWSPANDLNDPGILQPLAKPLSTRVYTLTAVGANGCSHSDALTINVTPRYSISGQIIYNNAYYSALPDVRVRLKNASQTVIDSTLADEGGNYIFPLNVNGNYSLDVRSSAESGGINATDALNIARHSVFLSPLSGLRLSAADVNASQTVTAADALLVLHHTVGNITTFPAGDWVFETPNFTLNGAPKTQDIYGLSVGDVNGSFIPSAKLESYVEIETQGSVTLPPDEIISLPVFLSGECTIGALSLGLTYPGDLIEIKDITSPLSNVVFRINEHDIKIAWNQTQGLHVRTDQPLFELKIKRKSLPDLPPGIVLGSLPVCEIAGPDADIIPDKHLVIPNMIPAENMNSGFWLGQNQPNPAENETEIPFIIPEDGDVRIVLFNQLGAELSCLMEEKKPAGSHILKTDFLDYPAGVYYYRMLFSNDKTRFSQSRRMVISK